MTGRAVGEIAIWSQIDPQFIRRGRKVYTMLLMIGTF